MLESSIQLPSDFAHKCDTFCELILRYNSVHNITGAKDKKAVIDNIEDSIYPLSFLPLEKIRIAIDVGSGAGFPGLILAMALPDISMTLFEPIAKKSSFLHLAKSTLNLENVTISTKRVEEAAAFETDLISSRAVGNTDLLLRLCASFITPKTLLLFYKGERVGSEVINIKNYKIYNKNKRNYLLLEDTNRA